MRPTAFIAAILTCVAPGDDERQIHTNRPDPRDLSLPSQDDAFSFVVFGDRTGGPAEGVEVLADAVRDTNLLGPDLVMTVGDLVEGYNDVEPWMTQMREFRGIMDGLAMPWFPVAGNHDIYFRGDDRPAQEHEGDYELHFGPLWYAFEHKGSWFVVLYSDEANPETGERNFNKAECQRISPEQLDWLEATLERATGAEHVFVFLHHPRWIGRNYGDDWRRVHERLVAAGNVSAVFGGHIHEMRYDPLDGIEYFALATVGGHQPGLAPRAGFLHQYHVVTVRSSGIDVTAYAVGDALDPRAITGDVNADIYALEAGLVPRFADLPAIGADGGAAGVVEVALSNPGTRPIELELTLESGDRDWVFVPDHEHATLGAGETRSFRLGASRYATGFGRNLELPELVLRSDYLAESARLPLPERRTVVPLDGELPAISADDAAGALTLDGGYARVPAEDLDLPDGPFTLECWVRGERFAARQGIVTKTENSEYGIFASGGTPSFTVHLGGSYTDATADDVVLATDRWQHLAGVFDGREVRLYVDGKLVAQAAASGSRTPNDLPLVVGGDVDRNGNGTSLLAGQVDEVRLSLGARYGVDTFAPERRHAVDDRALLLLHADRQFGPWIADASGRGAHGVLVGGAGVRPPRAESDAASSGE
ncbi:LamG-like jellyroll fold domain-containing protein [Engelhardtia mirabilis]|uniref:Calcineurin-like phosphoesterase n=1 Tax=Engelhardtia mirabilis TaxID=2528011 RepID=A0A518BIW7_9BACT|nr:Calcineurin-like phosphoesterase [Planctomycetes bacterium Pla133]QDV01239.1 Calcineurin-like phosphoesterase [Planctomycetes bacterium Pla86]